MIRTKIISYEKSNISFMNWRESLSKNYLVKFAKLVNRILIFSRRILIKLISISFILFKKIDLNTFIVFILNRRNLAKFIIKVMGKIGFRVQADKLITRSKQSKVYNDESRESSKYLLRYFHSSELAKKIFTRLESKEASK